MKNLFNFKNKIIFITGSSGQLGLSFVKLFLSQGAKVIGVDNVKNNFKNKNYLFLNQDITDKKKVEHTFSRIIKKFKKIDVIVNNAGVSIFTKYDKRKNEELDKVFNINVKGTLNIINAYSKIHKTRKLKRCSIVNIASIYGLLSPDFRIYGKKDNFNSEIYGASKAAVIQITKYYSVILSKLNINVNCLSPGGIENKKKPQNKSFIKKYSQRVPINRMGKPSDLYSGLLFLSCESSNYVNGQNIVIDGGLSVW
jgi:3-oxoacyl-[acyl-carrier protein] reductase